LLKLAKANGRFVLGEIRKEFCQCEPFQSPKLIEVNERFFLGKTHEDSYQFELVQPLRLANAYQSK
jgi:hypothetical protein